MYLFHAAGMFLSADINLFWPNFVQRTQTLHCLSLMRFFSAANVDGWFCCCCYRFGLWSRFLTIENKYFSNMNMNVKMGVCVECLSSSDVPLYAAVKASQNTSPEVVFFFCMPWFLSFFRFSVVVGFFCSSFMRQIFHFITLSAIEHYWKIYNIQHYPYVDVHALRYCNDILCYSFVEHVRAAHTLAKAIYVHEHRRNVTKAEEKKYPTTNSNAN